MSWGWSRDDVRLAVPLAVLVLVGVVDVWAGPGAAVLGLVVVAPLAAASLLGPRLTAAYAVAAMLMAAALGAWNRHHDPGAAQASQLLTVAVVAFGGVVAVAGARIRAAREARLAQVVRVAEVAQHAVLSPVPSRLGNLTLAACYESATSEATIGGDLYAALPSPFGIRLLVGDVRGKGLEAVRLGSHLLGAFRERADERRNPVTLLDDLDQAVRRAADGEDFVTVVLAQIDEEGMLTVVNAGHPPPLLLRDGIVLTLQSPEPRPPLGLDGDAVRLTVPLHPGDRLLLYTDGLAEARRPSDREFFPAEQLLPPTLGSGTLAEGLGALRAALLTWAGGHLGDDLALLAAELVRENT